MLDQARAAGLPRSGWGSWSERAIQSAPIRWGSVAAFALLRMRSARVQAMVSPGMARQASLGPTKVNRLRLIGLGDLPPIPAGGPFPKNVAPGGKLNHAA
jgi:hypothetical protein